MISSSIPGRKINPYAPKNISDEILAASIKFVRESRYAEDIVIISYFWCAFMLRAKNELNRHGLFANVVNCHLSSLGKAFPVVNEDLDLREAVNEMFNTHLSYLSSIPSEEYTGYNAYAVFNTANQLHARIDPSHTAPSIESSCELFSDISDNVCNNIQHLIYKNTPSFDYTYENTLGGVLGESGRLGSNAPTAKKKIKVPWVAVFWTVVMLAVIIGVIWADSKPSRGDADPELIAVAEPSSGTILSGKEYYQASEITVTASNENSCVVKLKTASGATRLSFYVRAGDTVTVGVPCEKLYVYFASGKEWYGSDQLFGKHTGYSMDDELLDFAEYTIEYTLQHVTDGNFSETYVDAADFN